MPREVKKRLRRRRRRRKGQKVMVKRRMTPMSSHLSLLVTVGRGQLKRKPTTSLTPKRVTKPPMSIKAVPLLAFLLNTRKE
jgi:hypothetical protein